MVRVVSPTRRPSTVLYVSTCSVQGWSVGITRRSSTRRICSWKLWSFFTASETFSLCVSVPSLKTRSPRGRRVGDVVGNGRTCLGPDRVSGTEPLVTWGATPIVFQAGTQVPVVPEPDRGDSPLDSFPLLINKSLVKHGRVHRRS